MTKARRAIASSPYALRPLLLRVLARGRR